MNHTFKARCRYTLAERTLETQIFTILEIMSSEQYEHTEGSE